MVLASWPRLRCSVDQLAPGRQPVGAARFLDQLVPMSRRPVGPVGLGRTGEKRRVSQLAPSRLLDQLAPTNRRPVDPQWTW